MIEDIKILVDAVSELENGAIYLIVGVIFYKLITFAGTTGAVVLLGKLFITKVHHWLVSERVTKITLDKIVIGEGSRLLGVVDRVKNHVNPKSIYLHDDGCRFISQAVEEKIERKKS